MDVDSQPQQESESTQEGQLKDELPFFSRGMQSWTILDTSFKEFLRRYTEKVLRETPTDVRNSRLALTLSYLKNIHYGVSNNMAHLSGQLISRAIKESRISHFLNNFCVIFERVCATSQISSVSDSIVSSRYIRRSKHHCTGNRGSSKEIPV